MSKTTKRVLPADVYDTLELSAEAYGGIGGGQFYEGEYVIGGDNPPCCVWGHAYAAKEGPRYWNTNEITEALRDADISANDNDIAVRAINERKGAPPRARVPFAKWVKELNVVRGA